MNYFLSLPEGIQDDVFSYISIMEHLEICTVSRKFNAMITNTNTPQMEGARDTITGWWVQENKYDHYHSLPITEYLEIFEEELLRQTKYHGIRWHHIWKGNIILKYLEGQIIYMRDYARSRDI